jgi:hypothetical protein
MEDAMNAQTIFALDAAPVDFDAIDAARKAAQSLARHAAYEAHQRSIDALPAWYSAGFAPTGPDEPRGPTGYAWIRERGE